MNLLRRFYVGMKGMSSVSIIYWCVSSIINFNKSASEKRCRIVCISSLLARLGNLDDAKKLNINQMQSIIDEFDIHISNEKSVSALQLGFRLRDIIWSTISDEEISKITPCNKDDWVNRLLNKIPSGFRYGSDEEMTKDLNKVLTKYLGVKFNKGNSSPNIAWC